MFQFYLLSTNESGSTAHHLQNQYSQIVERTGAFKQNAGNLQRWVDSASPRNHLWRFCWAVKVLKGKQKWSQLITEMGVRVSTIPHCVQACRLLRSSSRCYLVHTVWSQFVWEITEGDATEKIWSSVNYLFFISTSLIYGKNQQIGQGIVWSKDLKGVLGLEMSRAWGCQV